MLLVTVAGRCCWLPQMSFRLLYRRPPGRTQGCGPPMTPALVSLFAAALLCCRLLLPGIGLSVSCVNGRTPGRSPPVTPALVLSFTAALLSPEVVPVPKGNAGGVEGSVEC